jgi:hypothetical protein
MNDDRLFARNVALMGQGFVSEQSELFQPEQVEASETGVELSDEALARVYGGVGSDDPLKSLLGGLKLPLLGGGPTGQ